MEHPLFRDIHNNIIKKTGLDRLLEKEVNRIGKFLYVCLTCDFTSGKDSHVIELILIGDHIDREYLVRKVFLAEDILRRMVNFFALQSTEADKQLRSISQNELLPRWNCISTGSEENHTSKMSRERKDVRSIDQTIIYNDNEGGIKSDSFKRWYARCIFSSLEKEIFKFFLKEVMKFQVKRIPIPEVQIKNLRLNTNSNAEVEVTGEKFDKGDSVIVTTGSLKGLSEELISQGYKKKLLVRLDSIEHNITVTVPVSYLRKV